MKYIFCIGNVHFNNGVITSYLVYSRDRVTKKEKPLEFSTHESAEAWILGQRQDGETNIYQIHKMYVA